ncbi:MAG: DUF2147 domain-containing protein [Pseudomonadota bacterium]
MRNLLYMLLLLTPGAIADRDDVKGYWATDGSIFEIYEQDGTLLGQVRALREPVYSAEENPDLAGQARMDLNNPDAAQRSRPIMGIHMFSEYEYKGGQWQGKIYDPETGNTYQSKMAVNNEGLLEIRGYIGLPMFGRTAQFLPISTCEPHILEMLPQINQQEAC